MPFPDDDLPPIIRLKPRDYREPLAAPEAAQAMRKLTGYTTSALQTGLHVLDTPGSIVRGALGSLVGAKPAVGERTSGRDLTNAIGLTSRYDKGWGSWGAGLGAEILTDPLTYFTGGAHHALTDSGKALAKIGATTGWTRKAMLEGFHGTESGLLAQGKGVDDILHMRDQGARIATPEMEQAVQAATGKALQPNTPLGALGGFGSPFGSPKFLVGTGSRAKVFAGKLDRVGDKLKYDTTLGRWVNGLFDSNVGEAVGAGTQRAMSRYGSPALEAARIAGREGIYRTVAHLDGAIRAGIPEADVLRAARQSAEGVRLRGVDPAAAPAANAVGSLVRSIESSQLDQSLKAGLPLRDAADPFVAYAPRQGIDLSAAQQVASGVAPTSKSRLSPQVIDRNNIPTMTGSNFHRDDIWRGIPGGSEQVNDFARQFAGVSKKLAPQTERALKKQMWLEAQANGVPMDRALGKQLDSKATVLAKRLSSLPDAHAKHGIGLYSPNITQDVARSAEQHAQLMRSQAMTYGFIGDNARHKSLLGADAVPVSKVLKDLGFTQTKAADLAAGTPMEGALVQGYRALAKQGAGKVEPFLMRENKYLKRAVDQYSITRKHYDELIATHQKGAAQETLREPIGAFKKSTQTFKNLTYPIWLPSHVRNATTALGLNLSTGINLGDHALSSRVMRNTASADEIRKVMPDLPAGISDHEARDIVRREAFSAGKVFDGHAGQADLDNAIAAKLQSKTPGRITPELFGANRAGTGNLLGDTGRLIGGGIKEQLGDSLRYLKDNPIQNPFARGGVRSPIKNPFGKSGPLRQEGIAGATADNAMLRTGRDVGSNVEDYFRLAAYLGNRRQGMNSATAGQALRDLHFDYDKLTRFEKDYMRTAFPFYTYARKNLPLQLNTIAHTPAVPVAQMRAMQAGRKDNDYVPEHLAGGAAIPIGGGTPGHQRYISSFGTPLEEALDRLKFKNGMPDLPETTRAFLASGNPFIKAPIEQIFDRQLSSGRKLSDLRAQGAAKGIGGLWGDDNPQMLAQVMANTPFTRFFSTFDKATDGRKPLWARGLNLATGVRLTDVDMVKAQAVEAAKARNEILSSMPHISQYTNFYPTHGQEGNLSDEEVEMLKMLRTMQNTARHNNIGIAK